MDSRVKQMDAMLEAVRDGRVRYLRRVANAAAPDFYRYEWQVDGVRASSAQRTALEALHQRMAVRHDGFVPTMGAAEAAVDIG